MKNSDQPVVTGARTIDESLPAIVYIICCLMLLIGGGYPWYRNVVVIGGKTLKEYEIFAPVLGAICYLICIALMFYVYGRMKSFLDIHDQIDNDQTLEAFKSIARNNMKLVYPYLIFFVVALICGMALIVNYRNTGFIIFIIAIAIHGLLSLRLKKLEQSIRSLPAATETLDFEHKDIGHRWIKKAWPDF